MHSLLLSTLEEMDSLNLFGVDEDKGDEQQPPRSESKENQKPANASDQVEEAATVVRAEEQNRSINQTNQSVVNSSNYSGIQNPSNRSNKRKHDYSKGGVNKNANFVSKGKNDKNNNHGNVTGGGPTGGGGGGSSASSSSHNTQLQPPTSLPIQATSGSSGTAVGQINAEASTGPYAANPAPSSTVLNKTRDLKNTTGQTPAQATTAKLEDTR